MKDREKLYAAEIELIAIGVLPWHTDAPIANHVIAEGIELM
jgi:hypothetical protein